jgi:asparagine synthase (glutamine-hydrolysing)
VGALFLVRTGDPGFAEPALAGARAQFARHGFGAVVEKAVPGWRLLHAPHIIGGPESSLTLGADFVAVAGTLTYDGAMGRPALEALLRTIALPDPDWSRIGGQFAAFVHKGGRSFLLTDYFAAFQLHHDEEMRFFSTSLLAAAGALPKLHFDPQGVYEFAFNVFPIGDDTIFAELKTLGPNRAAELGEDGARLHEVAKPLPEAAAAMPLADRIEAHRSRLAAVVESHAAAFGDRIFCPLSGGLDSRLVLAVLRARGRGPSVFVYGPPDSPDVRIAEAIGAAEGFAVASLDKEAHPLAPDEFPARVERNFHEYDALPNYGELFENGMNAAARDARHAGGALAASGGCGEIYRNFFFLPDRPSSAATVARTFFARFAPGDATGAFDAAAFLRAIEDKILDALGRPGDRGRLPRGLIEQIYPRLRCRAAFGREISIEARYGAYLMPFLDHRVVAEAMTLPLGLKNAGRFEAMLLNAIDPALARLPSAYGHDFASPPTLRHRFGEWSTRARPAWLRQHSYAIRRRLRPMADEHGGLLGDEYLGRVIDLDYPAMRRFFRVERITDSGLMRRIACLEYFASYLGGRLAA